MNQGCKCKREYNKCNSCLNHRACPCRETQNCNEKCRCRQDELSGMPLAMAYVPWQQWNKVFEADCGLKQGTIFPELVKTFNCGCYKGM